MGCVSFYLRIALGLVSLAGMAPAQDFAALTALAEGALVGENVEEAVGGFEVRLLHDGKAIYHQAFGDWSLGQVAVVNSSTKNLSGALMMSLAETGTGGFSLDSQLSDFLPSFDKPIYRGITIRQAFSHTAGTGGLDPTGILTNTDITLQEAAVLISQRPLVNGPPGSEFSYGGMSMQAAGAAAEIAYGEPFIDLMAERITTPLAMADTRFVSASATNPRVAGGMESTATDYGRFMDMVLNGGVDRVTGTRVLQASSIAEMLTDQTAGLPVGFSPQNNGRYGIGVWLDQLRQEGPAVDALAGGAQGFHSWIDESEGLVFTFATDVTSFENVALLSAKMYRAILGAMVLPGDYNDDGSVDAADYTVWRDRFGQPAGGLPNDTDGGVIGAAQYATWAASFGSTATATAVPEPGGLVLALLAMGCQYGRVGHRHR